MLNERRIKKMIRLAFYERHEGKEDLKVIHYYKGDYISLHMIKRMIAGTVAFALIFGLWACCSYDYLMNNLHLMDLTAVITGILLAYIVFIAIYMGVTYAYYSYKYKQAMINKDKYSRMLTSLKKEFELEDKKALENASGGK